MRWSESESLSVNISKDTVQERLSEPIPENRKTEKKTDPGIDSISGERITNGILIQGTYKVISDPIRGGMGCVYRVHHTGWDVDLAMKRPHAKFFAEGSEKRKENFIHECRAWIDLGLHPNIVSCYYVREIGGVPSIFSEWMENGSLENRIDDRTLYEGTPEQVQKRLLDIAIQFARGLHYAHESGSGLIHQDVKPDNLLLSKKWDAKVADFGLARARTAAIAPNGGYTPAYCSPEQSLGEPLTRRTDIYSWAVSILEMYLGEAPWAERGKITGPAVGASCHRYLQMENRVPMPDKLKELLIRCLRPDPDARPHDFAEVEAELIRIYEEATGTAYWRPDPKAASRTADTLNNMALSFLDLGEPEKAEETWTQAILSDPVHVDARFNRELKLLREGKKFDFEVIEELNRIPAVKESDAARAIELECKGRADPLPAVIFPSGKYVSNLYLNKAMIVGEAICFTGIYNNGYGSSDWAVGWFERTAQPAPKQQDSAAAQPPQAGTKQDLTLHVRRFLEKKDVGYIVLLPDGKQAVQVMKDRSLRLYDYRQNTELARTAPIPELGDFCTTGVWIFRSGAISPDGKRLMLCRENRENKTVSSILIKVPELEPAGQYDRKFIGFLPDGRGILRSTGPDGADRRETDPTASPALFVMEPDGMTHEVFRFERAPEKVREYCGEKGVFLAYCCEGKADPGEAGGSTDPDCFFLDENFRPVPLAPELFRNRDQTLFYDAAQGLLCTGNDRIYIWDLHRQHCLYTVSIPSNSNVKAVYDEGHRQLLLWCANDPRNYRFSSRWQPLPLPGLPYSSEEAKWRLTRVVSAEERIEEDSVLAAQVRRFEESRERGDVAEMARIHRDCLEIPGFGGSREALQMEDVLEGKAVKNSLRAVRSISNDKVRGKFSGGETVLCSEERIPCQGKSAPGNGGQLLSGGETFSGSRLLVASYTSDRPEEGIGLYHPDGTLVRRIELPKTTAWTAVRGNDVLAFGKMLDAAKYSLSGKPADPSRPAPAALNAPDLNNALKYGPPILLAVDGEGRRILYAIDKPFDPFRKRKTIGFFQRDLLTGKEICLFEGYREWVRPEYLADGSILFPMPTPDGKANIRIFRIDAEKGNILHEYRILPDEAFPEPEEVPLDDMYWDDPGYENVSTMIKEPPQVYLSLEMVGPDRDQFLMRAYYGEHKECRLFDLDGELLGRWDIAGLDVPRLMPGGKCVCFTYGDFRVFDLQKQEMVYSEAAKGSVCFHPDGREVRVGEKLFRFEYDYEAYEEEDRR